MKRVMAIDPGTTTGIAIYDSQEKTLKLKELTTAIEFLQFFSFEPIYVWSPNIGRTVRQEVFPPTFVYIEKPFIFNQNKHRIKRAVAFYELTVMLCEELDIPWESVAPSFHKGWLKQAKACIGLPQKLHAQDALAILIGKNEIPINIL